MRLGWKHRRGGGRARRRQGRTDAAGLSRGSPGHTVPATIDVGPECQPGALLLLAIRAQVGYMMHTGSPFVTPGGYRASSA